MTENKPKAIDFNIDQYEFIDGLVEIRCLVNRKAQSDGLKSRSVEHEIALNQSWNVVVRAISDCIKTTYQAESIAIEEFELNLPLGEKIED